MENKKKCIKPVEPEPAIKPVQLTNRFLKHWMKQLQLPLCTLHVHM